MPDGAVDTHPSLAAFRLAVGDRHELYVETIGDPDGIPCLFLHGGPGSGCQPSHRQLFDPVRHYAVLFDQRGAGRSTPHGSREANTTQHLIADIEAIRGHLGIDKWLLVGGSWGATLAIAYAESHPGHVAGIVLRATFLGTDAELDWAFDIAPRTFHPALYDDFLSLLTEGERRDARTSYYARILHPDASIHAPAARAYAAMEEILASIRPASTRLDLARVNDPAARQPPSAFMEAHYFANDCFLAPNQLLDNAHRLAGIPGIIVQGQYDLLCPPSTSAALANKWPGAKIVTVPAAGHLLGDPGVTDAVKSAIVELA